MEVGQSDAARGGGAAKAKAKAKARRRDGQRKRRARAALPKEDAEPELVQDEDGSRAVVVDTDAAGKSAGKKKRKREERRQALIANKLWRHFDRKGQEGGQANRFFESYYRSQLGLEDGDWDAFADSLGRGLSVTFRLNRGRYPHFAAAMERRMKDEFRFSGSFVRIGMDAVLASSEVLNPVTWVSDVHRIGTDRIGLSKAKALAPLHAALEQESKLGHLTRQGVASMISAIALQPEPQHIVLDMCAAPGSKSDQLLQMMGPAATGAVVANDPDPKRLRSLRTRFRQVPFQGLAITCARGEDLYKHIGPEFFDGIVCDVPCSGDGTIRKFPYLWRQWRARRGVMLHPLQLQLAQCAASLLKVGGRMVYSTCSINPIEDEAVVAALLASAGGALRLLPVELGGFKVRPGMHSWDASEELMKRGSHEDVGDEVGQTEDGAAGDKPSAAKRQKNKNKNKKEPFEEVVVTDSMRPPSADAARKMELERCVRILNHDNDTEGFFVCLIEKVSAWELGRGAEKGKAQRNANDKDRVISAKSAQGVLRDVGFNPRLSSDLVGKQQADLGVDGSKRLNEQLKLQTGICAPALRSGAKLRFHREAEDGLQVSLLSEGVAAVMATAWARSGSVPVLHAGVKVASAPCVFDGKQKKVVECGVFAADPFGAVELAEVLDQGQSKDHFVLAECSDVFGLLQIAMASAGQAAADAEEVGGPSPPSDVPGSIHLSLRDCVEMLEGMDEEDEEETMGLSAVADPDLCQNDVAARMVAARVGQSVFVALRPGELSAEPKEKAAPKTSAQSGTSGRLSAAERRRLKKRRKGGKGADAGQGDAGAGASAATKDASEPELARVDMFSGVRVEPAHAMVLVLRKVGPMELVLASTLDQVKSFGQAMQILADDDEEEDDEEEEQ